MICIKCNENVTDAVLCSVCRGSLHYACAGLTEIGYRRMNSDKKAAWKCLTCRNMPNPATTPGSLNETQEGIAAVLKELRDFRSDFSSMKLDINNLKSDIQACTKGIQIINNKFTELEIHFSDIEDRLTSLEKKCDEIPTLQSELVTMGTTVSTLQIQNDAREQYSRLNNIEISGLPFKKGESLLNILSKLFTVVGLKMDENSIDYIQRVRRYVAGSGNSNEANTTNTSNTPAVIVKFTRRIYKDQLLSAVRARRGLVTSSLGLDGPANNIYVGDHLTPTNKLMLKRARQLKKDGKIAYVWVRDCKILVRKTETSKVTLINRNLDLDKIK
ncbi:unnamed protein product [Leptidea sinapis]|uniref:PHD-type domain-containing protein n=1 Tax=Leptidea sinapis TaxID=189913 RepID=A0A5E4QJS1_9NEOP|nr:unnamed protein product [Leptidea sinapis]